MKLVTFRNKGESLDRVGVLTLDESAVVDLSEHFPSMLVLIDGGAAALQIARTRATEAQNSIALADVKLQAPLPEPRQMRDCMSFERHFQHSINSIARMRVGVFAPVAPRPLRTPPISSLRISAPFISAG